MTSISTVTEFLVLSGVDAGGNFKVQVNGLTVVALEENVGSTGYVWKYEQATGTSGLLKLLADSGLYGDRSPLVGAPGAHVFLLEAARTGTTPLRFGLSRSGTPEPDQEVTFHIEIVPAD